MDALYAFSLVLLLLLAVELCWCWMVEPKWMIHACILLTAKTSDDQSSIQRADEYRKLAETWRATSPNIHVQSLFGARSTTDGLSRAVILLFVFFLPPNDFDRRSIDVQGLRLMAAETVRQPFSKCLFLQQSALLKLFYGCAKEPASKHTLTHRSAARESVGWS